MGRDMLIYSINLRLLKTGRLKVKFILEFIPCIPVAAGGFIKCRDQKWS
jgi:hypothetical protein